MSKPDWSTAPSWARWLAKDEDGTWRWYQEKPNPSRRFGHWQSVGGVSATVPEDNTSWEYSLEFKP